jgi:hypothetical protein
LGGHAKQEFGLQIFELPNPPKKCEKLLHQKAIIFDSASIETNIISDHFFHICNVQRETKGMTMFCPVGRIVEVQGRDMVWRSGLKWEKQHALPENRFRHHP